MKKYIFNNIIFIFFALLLITVIAYFFVSDFTIKERENYYSVINERLVSAADEAAAAVHKGRGLAEGLNYYDQQSENLLENYYALGYIAESGGEISIKTIGGENTYVLKGGAYDRLTKKDYCFALADKVFDGFEGNNYLLFFKSSAAGGTHFLIALSDSIFNERYIFNFENLMVVSSDGIIMTDYKGDTGGGTLSGLGFSQQIIAGNGGNVYSVYHNDNKFIAYNALHEGSPYKIAGYLSSAAVDGYIQKIVAKFIVFIIAIIAIFVIACVLIVIFYLNHYNKLLLIKAKNPLYMIKVNKKGDIFKANSWFKESFNKVNIFDNVFDNGISLLEILNKNLPMIVCIKNKQNEDRYITFFTISVFNGYKLIGEDTTVVMDVYVKNLIELRHNEHLKMFNKKQFEYDFKQLKNELRLQSGLYIVFEIRNINKYRSMFGEDFYKEIILRHSANIKEIFKNYGNLYCFDNEIFVLLILGNEKSSKFKENIKDYMRKLNMPLNVEKSLIKVDCFAGIVDLDYNIISSSISEIHSMAEFTLEKAYEIKRQFDYYDKTKEMFYISQTKKREIVKYISENKEIDVYFQPQYSILRNKIVGFEALSRIKGQYQNELSIIEFIEIAERTGQMISIGDYVFVKAFEFVKIVADKDVVVSLNVSPVQLLQTGFVSNFLEKAKKYDIKKGSVSLEITETFLMSS
ncbi:MAG: EAL domain-containing protein, partial [Clostridia bacterium]|nr:EAL domain-containing protein [Clostridia bacterium]